MRYPMIVHELKTLYVTFRAFRHFRDTHEKHTCKYCSAALSISSSDLQATERDDQMNGMKSRYVLPQEIISVGKV